MQTQREIELEGYAFGKERMARSIERNEEAGRADGNPYASAIYRRFVLPLAEIIQRDMTEKRPGRRQAHVQLMGDMDAEATAFVAVRAAMVDLITDKGVDLDGPAGRAVMTNVGKSVYHEHLLTHFANIEPVLFYHLTTDFERRMSKNERHRMTVYKLQAEKHGIKLPEWGIGDREQVGAYVMEKLSELGLCHINTVHTGRGKQRRTKYSISLTDEVKNLVSQISDYVIESTPYYLPCVEQPRDWVSVTDGGFHTDEMRRLMPWVVKAHPSMRDAMRSADMPQELAAVNTLQRTKWRINTRMLDALGLIHKHFDMEEVLSENEAPKPERPLWLTRDMETENMSAEQLEEFKVWKRKVAEWYTEAKARGVKWGRFYNALRVAQKFKDYESIYFVYFMDFRGRKYVQTTGVSPQGSDMQKALLEFSEGKPLDSEEAVSWFKITGANRFGYDKASLKDRASWVDERDALILSFASDPISNTEWTTADKPLQFLAWCFEYANWKVFGKKFRSRISVGMDGSCNGLQNFSAMLRDELGGKATNLVPSNLPNDIYQMVGDVTASLLLAEPDDERNFKHRWLAHGINRTVVKRSVMTLPYGSTRFSCAEFIAGDYLKAGKAIEFEKHEYHAAAEFLSHFVWIAIGEVVVKAREAMDWLQQGARKIVRGGADSISWNTPSGFPVTQVYWQQSVHQIHTKLHGAARLKVYREVELPDLNRHKNGIAPNFVHSLDASHLTLTTNACAALGVDALHMVHDDFGCHAQDAGKLYRVIREQFVRMYNELDPLVAFWSAYPQLDATPPLGQLDISQVLESPYFFS